MSSVIHSGDKWTVEVDEYGVDIYDGENWVKVAWAEWQEIVKVVSGHRRNPAPPEGE